MSEQKPVKRPSYHRLFIGPGLCLFASGMIANLLLLPIMYEEIYFSFVETIIWFPVMLSLVIYWYRALVQAIIEIVESEYRMSNSVQSLEEGRVYVVLEKYEGPLGVLDHLLLSDEQMMKGNNVLYRHVLAFKADLGEEVKYIQISRGEEPFNKLPRIVVKKGESGYKYLDLCSSD